MNIVASSSDPRSALLPYYSRYRFGVLPPFLYLGKLRSHLYNSTNHRQFLNGVIGTVNCVIGTIRPLDRQNRR